MSGAGEATTTGRSTRPASGAWKVVAPAWTETAAAKLPSSLALNCTSTPQVPPGDSVVPQQLLPGIPNSFASGPEISRFDSCIGAPPVLRRVRLVRGEPEWNST